MSDLATSHTHYHVTVERMDGSRFLTVDTPLLRIALDAVAVTLESWPNEWGAPRVKIEA